MNAEERINELSPIIDGIVGNANQLVVTEQSMGAAGDMVKLLKERIDTIEMERRTYTDPLNTVVKKINAGFAKLTGPLKSARESLRQRRDGVLMDIKRRESEEREREAEKKAAELEAVGKVEAAEHILEVAVTEPVKTAVRGGASVTSARFKPGYRLVDIREVPERFLLLNDSLVKSEMRAHYKRTGMVLQLPGLKTWEEVSGSTR